MKSERVKVWQILEIQDLLFLKMGAAMKQEVKKEEKKDEIKIIRKKENKFEPLLMTISIICIIAIIALFVSINVYMNRNPEEEIIYDYHYAFIGNSNDSYTTDRVCEAAEEYGEKHKVCVENMKLSADNDYTAADYMRMAKTMGVDGIILEGGDDPEIIEEINNAFDAGIPTITLMNDCAGSRRKSFVEIGDYNLGREYARTTINLSTNRKPKIAVLFDESMDEERDDIMKGIRETLKNEGNHLDVSLNAYDIDMELNFRAINAVKEILTTKSTKPDILICTNEKQTTIVYQTIKDYSLSNDAVIIGTGISESFLKAVKDGDFDAIIDVDAEKTGMFCVDALKLYNTTGKIDEHIIVEDTVVTRENVERYINND